MVEDKGTQDSFLFTALSSFYILLSMSPRRMSGEGSISKKGPPFIARFSYWEGGKLKRGSRSGQTRQEAGERMRKAQRDLVSGVDLDADKIKVADYLTTWLTESVANDVLISTKERYEQDVRLHIIPLLGHFRLKNLKPGEIERFRNRLLDKGLKPGTVNQCLVTLSVALNRAVGWELLTRNPVKAVKKVRDSGHGMACLSEVEAGRLVDVAGGTRREALYALALTCGLRQGELLALRWEDLNGRELTVRRSVDTTGPNVRWGTTKGKEERAITLPESLLETLSRHRKAQNEERLAARFWEDTGLVFPDETGRVQSAKKVLYQLRKDLTAASLPRIRFHDLRDTSATLQLKHGIHLHVVAKILGHKDPALTLRRYAHVLPDAREEAAQKMEGFSF